MSDKLIIYSFIKKSDYVFTKLKIEPNTITFFNNLIITPFLLYELYCNYYLVSILFIWIRAYLDALDGYIARKYNKCSKEGDIYDHCCDSLFVGALTTVLMNKINYLKPYSIPFGYISSVCAIVCDYDKRFYWITYTFTGAGGNENGYSFLVPCVFVLFTWVLCFL